MTAADPAPELLSRLQVTRALEIYTPFDIDTALRTALAAYDSAGRLWRDVADEYWGEWLQFKEYATDLAAKLEAAERERDAAIDGESIAISTRDSAITRADRAEAALADERRAFARVMEESKGRHRRAIRAEAALAETRPEPGSGTRESCPRRHPSRAGRSMSKLLPEAVGLQLYRIVGDDLRACEAMRFPAGRAAVDTVLRRAAISGRVEIEGEIKDHFADILDAQGDLIQTVALDRKSYAALKNKWMRCKLEPAHD